MTEPRNERPNNVFAGAVKPQRERLVDELQVQKSVIENSLKVKAQEIEKCAQLLEDTDLYQIKTLARFHNYEIVRRVFQVLMILNNIAQEESVPEFVSQFDLKAFVRFGSVNMVNPEKMQSVSALLKMSAGLNYETVKSFNKKFGIFFQFMISLVRCYDLNLRYALVLHQIEERKAKKLEASNLSNFGLREDQEGAGAHGQKGTIKKVEFDFSSLPSVHKQREPFFAKDIRNRLQAKPQKPAPRGEVLLTRIDYELGS